jgi:hypothetical protein
MAVAQQRRRPARTDHSLFSLVVRGGAEVNLSPDQKSRFESQGTIPASKEKDMPKDAHNKAPEHHDSAAKSHKMAAEHHGKGEHAKGREESAKAQTHSKTAREHSDTAHGKSQSQK